MSKSKVQDVMTELRRKSIDFSTLSDESSPCNVTGWISSGCIVLDKIMGGGFPIGRVTEIFGEPSTGKSLIAAQVAAVVQESGGVVAYADTETAVSRGIMEMVGVKLEELIYISPDTVEEVFTFFEEIIVARKKVKDTSPLFMIWDSVAATSAQFEMDAEFGKATMGRHAGLISQSLRKMTRLISKEHTHLLLLNQTRQKIGSFFGGVTTFGGNAIRFHSSIRIYLSEGHKIKVPGKRGAKIVGIETKATVVKNKVAVPFQTAVLPIYFGHGVDDSLAAFYYLKDIDILKKSGSWYTMEIGGEEQRFQKATWEPVFDKHYDAICDIVMEDDNTVYDVSEEEDEDEDEK